MSGAEFAEHLADFERDPWGEQRADLRAARQPAARRAGGGHAERSIGRCVQRPAAQRPDGELIGSG